jgi:plasmid maintenance system antidote protein VapI
MAEKTQYVTIHPGEVLRIVLDDNGISQKEFAATLAMPAPVLNDILKGK